MGDLVSVVMPSYNTGKYIKASIESVLNQTYKDFELLIVDDASTDDTLSIVDSFLKDERIKCFRNQVNKGAAECRNLALREARGRWIAFLDSDDLWMPQKLEKQVDFMRKNGYAFSYTNYAEMDYQGKRNGKSITGPKQIKKRGFYDYCWPGCLTVMFDADKVGLIQIKDIKKNNDYAMWLRVCQKADCHLLDEELALYRRGREGSVSTHGVFTMLKWHYKLFREAEGMNAPLAFLHVIRNMIFGLYKKVKYVKTAGE